MDSDESVARPLKWVGSSKDDLMEFPDPVRKEMGYALYLAQIGMKAPKAKPLRGFGGAGVLEVVEDFDGDAYRAVYAVKFRRAVFVLHAFQKKSKRNIETPRAIMELIKARLKWAGDIYNQIFRSGTP
jgi:phage-related protein